MYRLGAIALLMLGLILGMIVGDMLIADNSKFDNPVSIDLASLKPESKVNTILVDSFNNVINIINEHRCMTMNVYREAGNQSEKGMLAVAQVVMNRVTDPRWPDSVCDVVYEKNFRGCQFSWVCVPRLNTVNLDNPIKKKAWDKASQIAVQVLVLGRSHEIVGNATHYHAVYVKPSWRNSMVYVTTIGQHKFYSDVR